VPSQGGLTVLMAASFRGLTAIVSLLLQHGAELELRSREVSDRPSPPSQDSCSFDGLSPRRLVT
jgi:ankyrin repeat protein